MGVFVFSLLLMMPLAAPPAKIALGNCESTCGGVDIPYPFGTSYGCHRRGFRVTCDRTHRPPKLFLQSNGPEVLEISVRNATVRVRAVVWSFAAAGSNASDVVKVTVLPSNLRPYALSAARNALVVVGCGFQLQAAARPTTTTRTPFGSCAPSCPAAEPSGLRHGRRECDGVGCCQAPIPAGITSSFHVNLSWLDRNATAAPPPPSWVAPGARMVTVEKEWWSHRRNALAAKMSLLLSSARGADGLVIPAVLDWALNASSCAAAAKRSDFGCVSKNSECVNSTSSAAAGYVCRCNDGYDGNPYLPGGCQDPRMRLAPGVFLSMGVGIGMCLLLLVLAAIYAIKRLRARKVKKVREYFFKQNRGLLLQQLVDKDIAERMIFKREELEKATAKFDEARILGGGGHGTVYKGILLNQHVVAIKKSKFVIQKEIDEFINEVAILSQINHRNVVKLFGCCLRDRVYEFIPNGTLYAHLHVGGSQRSLPWKDRLRIAFEVADSLAYLHSAASISIVHRDTKTSNILLDDRLTAKVSDFGASRGIAVDQSSVTTGIQGTHGYMDPEYCYTARLTDKSDVYSYGVMLVELLTRKKPSMYMSPEGASLVVHFTMLLNQDKLYDILDEQVIEEGEDEV
uniref:Protein kinase domain-containing protein n=1 Tax=Oryza punctata TaxID=4537 RepID=A0A0E0LWJ3_ORYPU